MLLPGASYLQAGSMQTADFFLYTVIKEILNCKCLIMLVRSDNSVTKGPSSACSAANFFLAFNTLLGLPGFRTHPPWLASNLKR